MNTEHHFPPNCGNCAFRVEVQLPPPNLGKQSLCHLMPPIPVAVNHGGSMQIIPLRPPVAPDGHCFQFQPHPSLNSGAANDALPPPEAPPAAGSKIALPD